jgi:hypothetical protein
VGQEMFFFNNGNVAFLGGILHHLPAQTVPFQEYPLLQLHRNDPTMLMHLLFWGQLSIDREHSSMSTKKYKK